jgi:hypothetical protein
MRRWRKENERRARWVHLWGYMKYKLERVPGANRWRMTFRRGAWNKFYKAHLQLPSPLLVKVNHRNIIRSIIFTGLGLTTDQIAHAEPLRVSVHSVPADARSNIVVFFQYHSDAELFQGRLVAIALGIS